VDARLVMLTSTYLRVVPVWDDMAEYSGVNFLATSR
jgi:hypothetical protein